MPLLASFFIGAVVGWFISRRDRGRWVVALAVTLSTLCVAYGGLLTPPYTLINDGCHRPNEFVGVLGPYKIPNPLKPMVRRSGCAALASWSGRQAADVASRVLLSMGVGLFGFALLWVLRRAEPEGLEPADPEQRRLSALWLRR